LSWPFTPSAAPSWHACGGLPENQASWSTRPGQGRLRFEQEADPRGGRAGTLRRLLDRETAAGRPLWAAFDWVGDVSLDAALRQQRELQEVIHERPATLAMGVLERVLEDWSLDEQRRARHAHHGLSASPLSTPSSAAPSPSPPTDARPRSATTRRSRPSFAERPIGEQGEHR